MRRLKTVRRPPIYPKTPGHLPYSLTHPLPLSSRRPSVSFGGFGLTDTCSYPGLKRSLPIRSSISSNISLVTITSASWNTSLLA